MWIWSARPWDIVPCPLLRRMLSSDTMALCHSGDPCFASAISCNTTPPYRPANFRDPAPPARFFPLSLHIDAAPAQGDVSPFTNPHELLGSEPDTPFFSYPHLPEPMTETLREKPRILTLSPPPPAKYRDLCHTNAGPDQHAVIRTRYTLTCFPLLVRSLS